MFGICTEGITVPKTIWSISLGLSSQRCTSSETTSFPRSSAVRFRNEVPALTNGVRTPPMMAVRRPVRFVISTLLLAPQLEEEVPGVDPGVVAVAPLQARGISSDRLEVLRPHVGFDLGFADGALPAPLVDASRAWAACPKPVRPEAALLAVVPADVDSPVRRDGDVSGPYGRSVRLQLVEEAHDSRSVDRLQVDARTDRTLQRVITLAGHEERIQRAACDGKRRHGGEVGLERPDGPPAPGRRHPQHALAGELPYLRERGSVVSLVAGGGRDLRGLDVPVGPLDDLDEDYELLVPLAPFPEGGLGEERHVGGGLRSLERCAGESAIAGRDRLDIPVRGPRPSVALRRPLVGRRGLAEARGGAIVLSLRNVEIHLEVPGQRLLHVVPVDVVRILGAAPCEKVVRPAADRRFDARLLLDERFLARRNVHRTLPRLGPRPTVRIEGSERISQGRRDGPVSWLVSESLAGRLVLGQRPAIGGPGGSIPWVLALDTLREPGGRSRSGARCVRNYR